MADEATVRGYMTAHAPLTALVSTRIYDQVAPATAGQPPARPFVVMSVIDDRDLNTFDPAQVGSIFVIQVDVYADNKAAAKGVVAAIRGALHGQGFEDASRDLPADDPALRRISMQWRFALNR